MVQLESRVKTLETRGSSHVAEINNRLTVTEKETEINKLRLQKIVEIMTRELHISPSRVPSNEDLSLSPPGANLVKHFEGIHPQCGRGPLRCI